MKGIKRSISIAFFLMTFVFLGIGQADPRDDFWKDVERRKNLKKKDSDDLSLKYDSLIFNSCGSKVMLLKQDYVYEKKDKRFVKGNDDYYRRVYGVGVSTQEGVLTSKHLSQPWIGDNSLLLAKGFNPVLTNVSIVAINDSILVAKEEGKYEISLQDSFSLYPIKVEDQYAKLSIQPDSTGLLVLFYHDMEKDSTWRRVKSFSPNWEKGEGELDSQWIDNQLIGGFFVNVDTAKSRSDFIIAGLLSGDVPGDFKLIKLYDKPQQKTSEKTSGGSKSKNKSAKGKKSSSCNYTIRQYYTGSFEQNNKQRLDLTGLKVISTSLDGYEQKMNNKQNNNTI